MATYREPYYRLNAYDEPAIPSGLTELRTHGVNGAPPEQLLNDPHPVLVSGDDTAAFYRSREQPSGPLQRTVEAYSWTGLNSRAGSRAFWLLLFPFGMVNFAGWLVPDPWPGWKRWRTPLARGLIRLLGAAFTVHYALWAMVIAVDLLAAQCGQLPTCYDQGWLGWLKAIRERLDGPAALMVAFTAVPLLLIGVLWLLGRRNAELYDRYWAATDCDTDGDRDSDLGLVDDLSLRQPDFWKAPYFVQLQALLHATAAAAAVGASLAWTLVRAADAGGARLAWLGRLGWVLAAVAGLALAATAATGALRHRRATKGHPYPEWKRPAHVLLGGTLGLVALVGWLGWSVPVELTAPLPGLRAAFGLVMLAELVLLLLLCWLVDLRLGLSIILAGYLLYRALDWDQPRPWWPWWLLLAAVVAVVALGVYRFRSRAGQDVLDPSRHLDNPYWIFAGLAAVMLVTILGWRAEQATWPERIAIALVPVVYLERAFATQVRHGHDYPPSWRLRGGGLAAIAAVGGIGLTVVSAASIVFVADRLGKAVALLPGMDVTVGTGGGDELFYPGELGWIAAATLASLVIFVLALSMRIWSLWRSRWKGQIGEIHKGFENDPGRLEPSRADVPDRRRRRARSAAWARLFGSLVDDADWLISAAVVTLLAGAVSLVLGLRDAEPPSKGLGQIVGFSSWALGLTVLGAIWLVRSARTDTGLRRAVGIVWEVASFFPRRFHPLAPPSYAERSVPELRGRLLELTSQGQVLLVAHSQGTLVSAAALLTLLDNPACRPRIRRIAWITYGCMLRRLFGRAYSLAVHRDDLVELKAAVEQLDGAEGDGFPAPPADRPPYWMNFGRHSDYLGGRVFVDLQRPPPHHTEDRCDDVFFGDPTRRWRFLGQTQHARLWRHSFDYLDDADDRRFGEHVARVIQDLRARPGAPRG